jgi:hypothetical protein
MATWHQRKAGLAGLYKPHNDLQIIVGGHRPFYFNFEAFAKAFAKDTNGILHKL